MIASEATPLIKVGGLADVVGALPSAVAAQGHDVRILLPRYGALIDHGLTTTQTGVRAQVFWDGSIVEVEVYEAILPGTTTPLYLLDAPAFFSGGAYVQDSSPEGFRAQMQRFTFFSWAAAHLLPSLPWQPDVLHCHDWHAAAVPMMAKLLQPSTRSIIPAVVTIHNIESQGRWNPGEVFRWLGITGTELPSLRTRVGTDLNLLQQGLLAAEAVTTVSPTYAQEILRPEFGLELDQTLRDLPRGVVGIVNGIDVDRFNPQTDPTISAQYSLASVDSGKQRNRSALADHFGWSDEPRPVLGVVSRLTAQKGVELLVEALPTWVQQGGRVAILGTGQPELEQQLIELSKKHHNAIAVKIGFDAAVAQQIYAGADFFAMPSRFEPCGLGQLIAMRYGAIPIVRDTGGLHDTVVDVTKAPERGTGFVFQDFSSAALADAFNRALRLWQKPDILLSVRQQAMRQDYSWAASADAYVRVYASLKKS